ncbi:MAG: hypothetical protein H6672_01100 [Anaerolineaceae bacterium]|nr:hypothetical protein [Anaerolineaceae bacterium]
MLNQLSRVISMFLILVVGLTITGYFVLAQDESLDTYVVFNHVDMSNPRTSGIYTVNVNGSNGPLQLTNDQLETSNHTFVHSPDNNSIYYTGQMSGVIHAYLDGSDPVVMSQPNTRSGRGRYVISPNGQNVVLRGSTFTAGSMNILITTSSDTGAGTIIYEGSGILENFEVTPDSNYVIFQDSDGHGGYNLFQIPIMGGEALQLNPRLAAGGSVVGFVLSPTGEEVVYVADQNFDDVFEFFAVSIQGGEAIPLSSGIDLGNRYIPKRFQITPDGQHVIFNGNLEGRRHLFSVPISGGEAVQLSEGIPARVTRFHITSDSQRVVFVGNQGDLYSASVIGGDTILLAEVNDIEGFSIAPDNSRVLYMIPLPGYSHAINIVDINGGEPIQLTPDNLRPLSDSLPYSEEKRWAQPIAVISPDSRFLVFAAEDQNNIPGVYSVSLNGGDVVQLNDRPGSRDFNVFVTITADSQYAIYILDQEFARVSDIYSVPIQGGDVVRLTTDEIVSTGSNATAIALVPQGNTWIPLICNDTALPYC